MGCEDSVEPSIVAGLLAAGSSCCRAVFASTAADSCSEPESDFG